MRMRPSFSPLHTVTGTEQRPTNSVLAANFAYEQFLRPEPSCHVKQRPGLRGLNDSDDALGTQHQPSIRVDASSTQSRSNDEDSQQLQTFIRPASFTELFLPFAIAFPR